MNARNDAQLGLRMNHVIAKRKHPQLSAIVKLTMNYLILQLIRYDLNSVS